MRKKFLAQSGDEFTIEWYYNDNGNSPALEYYEELSAEQKKKLIYLFKMLADTGKILSTEKFRNEDDQIYAFKPKPDRFLCFFTHDAKVIVTNAFEKKSDKMPPREKQKALKARVDYIKRTKEDTYYD